MRTRIAGFVSLSILLAALGGTALIAQDKYSVKVPDGLGFSDFRGYEAWQVVSVSHPGVGEGTGGNEALNVILANPVMIDAYAAGIPANGKPFPDGVKTAKIQYVPKKSAEAPFNVSVPDNLRNVAFMLKGSERFSDSGGWGYANFKHDLRPTGSRPMEPAPSAEPCAIR